LGGVLTNVATTTSAQGSETRLPGLPQTDTSGIVQVSGVTCVGEKRKTGEVRDASSAFGGENCRGACGDPKRFNNWNSSAERRPGTNAVDAPARTTGPGRRPTLLPKWFRSTERTKDSRSSR